MAFLLRRAVVLVVGGSGAFILVQKLLRRTKPDSSGQPSPLELVAKGASQLQNNVGAFSLHDTLLALTAMSKVSKFVCNFFPCRHFGILQAGGISLSGMIEERGGSSVCLELDACRTR